MLQHQIVAEGLMGAEFSFILEFAYIPLYCEWTKRVLACFSQRLRDCSLYQAIYASLYSYNRDAHVLHAFCESWCPTTNALHTLSGKLSMSLWDLRCLSGLPIYG